MGAPHADLPRAEEARRRISVAYSIPGLRKQGWTFENDPRYPDCMPDTVNGFHYLHEAYTASNPNYTGKVTVPTLWDKKTKRIVNNESSEIIRMLNSEFDGITGDDNDYLSAALRAEIDRINERVYANVNNGVYRCGFAKSQAPTRRPTTSCSRRSTSSRRGWRDSAIWSAQITEADWRLFPTLVRFDVAYFSLFKCNKKRIADYPNLELHARALTRARRRRHGDAALLRDQLLLDPQGEPDHDHPQGDASRPDDRQPAWLALAGVASVAGQRRSHDQLVV